MSDDCPEECVQCAMLTYGPKKCERGEEGGSDQLSSEERGETYVVSESVEEWARPS